MTYHGYEQVYTLDTNETVEVLMYLDNL